MHCPGDDDTKRHGRNTCVRLFRQFAATHARSIAASTCARSNRATLMIAHRYLRGRSATDGAGFPRRDASRHAPHEGRDGSARTECCVAHAAPASPNDGNAHRASGANDRLADGLQRNELASRVRLLHLWRCRLRTRREDTAPHSAATPRLCNLVNVLQRDGAARGVARLLASRHNACRQRACIARDSSVHPGHVRAATSSSACAGNA